MITALMHSRGGRSGVLEKALIAKVEAFAICGGVEHSPQSWNVLGKTLARDIFLETSRTRLNQYQRKFEDKGRVSA